MLKKRIQILNSILLAVAIVQSGCKNHPDASLPYYNTPDFTPHWSAQSVDHQISNFSFIDQDGFTISNETINNKIHVANFFFSSCISICPKMTVNLASLQKEFANNDNVVLLSYSVMPWKDSVARLKKYAAKYGIRENKWHLLTGSTEKIYSLARKSYFAEEQTGFTKDSTEFLHTEHFILVDQHGYIRGIYNGTLALETERLRDDIRLLLKETD